MAAANASSLSKIYTVKGTSLVVQWIRVCLPKCMVIGLILIREGPRYLAATKPMCHNYRKPVQSNKEPAQSKINK